MKQCPLCAGILCVLGRLGNVLWFRCNDCGTDLQLSAADQHGCDDCDVGEELDD